MIFKDNVASGELAIEANNVKEYVDLNIGKVVSLITCLLLVGCGGGSGDTKSDQPSNDPGELPRSDVREESSLYAYRRDSPYASVLKECALIEHSDDGCTLQTLPFIGQSGSAVTQDDVLDRLLVTHDWMGERFASVLEDAPNDLLQLFASITSISIGSTVRPSNYWTGTAAIRLDADYIWTTLEEKATVSIAEDYRSDYGKDLNFWFVQSARRFGERAYRFPSLTSYTLRTFEEMKLPLLRLLYHELGHAVDYVNPRYMALLDDSLNTWENIKAFDIYRGSKLLTQVSPLQSDELKAIAQVRFRGEEATLQQSLYTPNEVGSFMASDGAVEYYSYSTEREDFANMLEASMMKKHFDIDIVLAFVTKPIDESEYYCEDLRLGWGQRNRLSDPLVWPRAKWVVDNVYGANNENGAFFDRIIGESSDMDPNLNWCDNRDGVMIASNRAAKSKAQGMDASSIAQELMQDRRSWKRHH